MCNFAICTINWLPSKDFFCCIIKFSCKIWWIQLFENLLIPIIYRSEILTSISIIDIIYNIVNFRFFESILKLISVWSSWFLNPIKHILPHLHISLMMLISKKTFYPKSLVIIIWKSAIKPLSLPNISYHCCSHNWSQTSILNDTFPTEKDFFERIAFSNSTINGHSTWIINSSLKQSREILHTLKFSNPIFNRLSSIFFSFWKLFIMEFICSRFYRWNPREAITYHFINSNTWYQSIKTSFVLFLIIFINLWGQIFPDIFDTIDHRLHTNSLPVSLGCGRDVLKCFFISFNLFFSFWCEIFFIEENEKIWIRHLSLISLFFSLHIQQIWLNWNCSISIRLDLIDYRILFHRRTVWIWNFISSCEIAYLLLTRFSVFINYIHNKLSIFKLHLFKNLWFDTCFG